MPVIIQQGKIKIIAMPGVFVGANETEDKKTMEMQRKYFENEPETQKLINEDEDQDDVQNVLIKLANMLEEAKNE